MNEYYSIDVKISELYPTLTVWEAVAKLSLVNFIFANIPSFITWPNLNQPSCPCQLSSVNIWNEIIFPLLKKPTTRTLSTHYCQRMNANKFNYWVEIWVFIYVSFQILHVHLDLTLVGLIIWVLFINIVYTCIYHFDCSCWSSLDIDIIHTGCPKKRVISLKWPLLL